MCARMITCQIEGCQWTHPEGHLMCGFCWELVPRELRWPVRRAYDQLKHLRSRETISPEAMGEALKAYRTAERAAIESVPHHPERPGYEQDEFEFTTGVPTPGEAP